jgi:hypothetical protein
MRVAGSALVTDSHAKHEPAPGELVDGSGLARDVPRPPPRERNDFDAQGHAARAHGRGGEDGPRIAGRPCGVALVADVVLEEDAVPPVCSARIASSSKKRGSPHSPPVGNASP